MFRLFGGGKVDGDAKQQSDGISVIKTGGLTGKGLENILEFNIRLDIQDRIILTVLEGENIPQREIHRILTAIPELGLRIDVKSLLLSLTKEKIIVDIGIPGFVFGDRGRIDVVGLGDLLRRIVEGGSGPGGESAGR